MGAAALGTRCVAILTDRRPIITLAEKKKMNEVA